jgi:lysophospholipid acyltransferase (LPLAT)-like uncharacterized protein
MAKRIAAFVVGWLVRWLVTLWLSTCRLEVFGREVEEAYRQEHPTQGLLYASWHCAIVFFAYFFRDRNLAVLVSTSRDGELASQLIRPLGFVPVRGSSSRRGLQALREMKTIAQKGYRCGVVVDGPRGPRQVSKIGIIYLARLSGLPIIPVIWSADRHWRLNSWDRTVIPKPFARIALLYHDKPIFVAPDASRDVCEQYRRTLDRILNRMTFQTEMYLTQRTAIDPRHIADPNPLPPSD